MDDFILTGEGLTKRFPQGQREIEVLHGVDLRFKRGEIVAILGPSGAGKSTLLHILVLMEQPTSGILRINDLEVQHLSMKKRAELRSRTLGFLFQFHYLLAELSVLENVMLPQRILGVSEARAMAKAKDLLQSVGLQAHLDKRPTQLSGGEQQRVSLARALINEPALILTDEPTGNLDKETGETVLQLLFTQARQRSAATVIVTHQEDIADRADRWIRLRDGRIETSDYRRQG